jgi:hypothetical protein
MINRRKFLASAIAVAATPMMPFPRMGNVQFEPNPYLSPTHIADALAYMMRARVLPVEGSYFMTVAPDGIQNSWVREGLLSRVPEPKFQTVDWGFPSS